MTQVLELSHNKTATTTILHNCAVKVNTIEVNKKIDVVSREIEKFTKKNQAETLDLKTTIYEVKNSLEGLNSRWHRKELDTYK